MCICMYFLSCVSSRQPRAAAGRRGQPRAAVCIYTYVYIYIYIYTHQAAASGGQPSGQASLARRGPWVALGARFQHMRDKTMDK